MTVLRGLVDEMRKEADDLEQANKGVAIMGFAGRHYQLMKDIKRLESKLPAEEQQIRDAAEAGYNWRRYKGKATEEDIETYITNLKKK